MSPNKSFRGPSPSTPAAEENLIASPKYLNLIVAAVDILQDESTQPRPSTASDWKMLGYDFYQKKMMNSAKEAFRSGLKVCEENDIKKELKWGMLAVDYDGGYWEKAIAMGQEILRDFKGDKMALLQLGRACYAARQFEASFDYYMEYYGTPKDHSEKSEEIKRVEVRLLERFGKFNLFRLMEIHVGEPLREIDCADYKGPVKINKIPGKGRHLVLTEDVEEDQLLIVSKAVAATLQEESTEMSEETLRILQAQLLAKLTSIIGKNPNLFGPQVFNLSSGPRPNFRDPQFQLDPIRDVETLQNICHLHQRVLWKWSRGRKIHRGIGLFILPSYFNHVVHCEPNVSHTFYNDVMVITSGSKLKAGTELTIHNPREDDDSD